ncbi:hypothetical protein [Parabacteroides sp. ZJ-118]|uniref:hypothetical protein n=1 Tax=Parabacteroides sp. ZJ-118 TaxID=2709398 RepID=UPI0013EA3264|nr:hypothetical protein [Parabacteroides sp. ZJ-118]
MKLYIPTSSLNLDNILQAESISPLSFYAQRKTGYKSIELIDEVKRFPNHIILFDYPVSFTIHDPERDNFPLLIEIAVDDCKQFNVEKIDGKEIYLCSHTIDLTPMNSRLFFFSENEYKMTIINTKDNRAIKYYKDYRIYPTVSSLKLKDLNIIPNCSDIAIEKSQETVKDKVKGAFYAYLLGQELSLTPELAHLVKLTQDLYDVLTSIISAPRIPDLLLKRAEELYEKYKNSIEGFKKQFGEHWTTVKEFFSKKWGYEFFPSISPNDYSLLRYIIELHTNHAIEDWKKGQAEPTDEGCCLENGALLLKEKPFINRVVNFIIKNEITVNYISANRLVLCKELVKEIKEEIGKERGLDYWENSSERKYFDNLSLHIRDIGRAFNIKGIDNEELIAIAVFLLRGESYKGITSYMKLKELSDYKNILILWGTLCGYMEMDRNIFPANVLTLEICEMVNRHLSCFSVKAKELENSVSVDRAIVADYLEVLKMMDGKNIKFDEIRKSVEGLDDNNIGEWIKKSLPCLSGKAHKRSHMAEDAYLLVLHKNEQDKFSEILKTMKVTKETQRYIAQYFGYEYSKEKQTIVKEENQKGKNAGQELDLFSEKLPDLKC